MFDLKREEIEELLEAYRHWMSLSSKAMCEAYKAVGHNRYGPTPYKNKEEVILAYYRLRKSEQERRRLLWVGQAGLLND